MRVLKIDCSSLKEVYEEKMSVTTQKQRSEIEEYYIFKF